MKKGRESENIEKKCNIKTERSNKLKFKEETK